MGTTSEVICLIAVCCFGMVVGGIIGWLSLVADKALLDELKQKNEKKGNN